MLRCVSVSLLITVLSLCSGCRSGKESSDAGEVNGDHIAVDKVGIAAFFIGHGVHVLQFTDIIGAHPAILPCNGVAFHAALVVTAHQTVQIDLHIKAPLFLFGKKSAVNCLLNADQPRADGMDSKVDGLMLNVAEGCSVQITDHVRRHTEDAADLTDLKLSGLQKLGFVVRQAQRDEGQSYKIALRELQDKTNKLRDELKSNGICYTEEYNSLMAKIEAASNNSPEQAKLLEQLQSMTEEQQYAPEFLAERKRYQAERKATLLKIVSREPSIARFSILARLMVYNLPD